MEYAIARMEEDEAEEGKKKCTFQHFQEGKEPHWTLERAIDALEKVDLILFKITFIATPWHIK